MARIQVAPWLWRQALPWSSSKRWLRSPVSTGHILLASTVLIAVGNILLSTLVTPNRSGPRVKGLKVTRDGSVLVSMSGLVAPDQSLVDTLMRERVIHRNQTNFILKPSRACAKGDTDLVVAVISNAVNVERRRRTRASFNTAPLLNERVRLVFFLSTYPRLEGLQRKIARESRLYGDVAQIRAEESYRNLPLKSVAVLFWATHFCGEARYVLKQDDDVKLPIPDVMRALRERSMNFDHFIVGNSKLLVERPIRDELSKYYTSYEEFGEPFYPVFAHGPGYAFPMATARLLFEATLRTRVFWLEDVYITGLCAARAGVPVFYDDRFVLDNYWGRGLNI